MKFYIQLIWSKKNSLAIIIKPFLFLFLILQLVVCPLGGQALQKKHLVVSDYPLWSDMRLTSVSPDGKWISYILDYENQADTLFVRNTNSKKVFHFTEFKRYEFIKNDRFVSLIKDHLQILNLNDGSIQNISNVKNYVYSAITNQLAIVTSEKENSTLSIIDSKNKTIKKIESVSFFLMSPDSMKIVYISKSKTVSKLAIMDLKTGFSQKLIIENGLEIWDHFVWQEQSKSLSFFRRNSPDSPNSLSFYDIDKGSLTHLNPKTDNMLPEDKFITDYYKYPLSISADGECVFFCVTSKQIEEKVKIKTGPEIWYTKTKQIYSLQERTLSLSSKPSLAVWFPLTNKIKIISSAELPEVMLTGNQRYALLSNPFTYEPTFEDGGPRDFYIMNLKTGKQELLVKNIEDYKRNILPSPTGKYIAYFRENNWWIYNTADGTHNNVTQKIGSEFSGLMYSQTVKSPYGNPGWTLDDKEILLYDSYDIWAIKPDGSFRKLTSGRDRKMKFRIAYNLGEDFHIPSYEGFKSSTIKFDKNIILRSEGEDANSGYFKWDEKYKEYPIVHDAAYIDQIYFNLNTKSFIYQRQDFNRSPYLVNQCADKTPYTFFESNKHQSGYYWGNSEQIEFKNSKGSLLRAGLYYPAGYTPEKKYPMIVHVYEKQSQEIHKFRRPTLLEYAGFNPAVLTLQGYFVLCPDIEHEIGKVGQSTVDCVTAATKAVIDKGLVEVNKIGLMGHSFGGYESAFIVTQTSMFAAAVAGAASTDLTSAFLSINWNTGKANMKRFKKEQYRLGVSPFEEPLTYLRNSPITNAAEINKPLLLWSGKKDQQVSWHQSVELYLAMHRLQKNNIMLLYPNEEHSIVSPENQKDLSIRILQWFDHFLKGEKPAEWIEKRS